MKINPYGSTSLASTENAGRPTIRKDVHAMFGAVWVLVLVALATAGVAVAQEPGVTEEPQPSSEVAGEPQPPLDEADAAPSSADESNSCAEAGKNVQCTDFGSIKMDARRDVRGDPLDLTTEVYLNTGYGDRGARWVMFSVRNVTDDGPSPVTIGLSKFSTAFGDVVTTRVEQPKPSELNLWVDVLDLPIGTPISLAMSIGATERGAFTLETLVLAFDRGYAPVQDTYGADASLFSFTVLGVNKETHSTAGNGDDSLVHGNKLPALGLLGVLAAVGATIVRRQSK